MQQCKVQHGVVYKMEGLLNNGGGEGVICTRAT